MCASPVEPRKVNRELGFMAMLVNTMFGAGYIWPYIAYMLNSFAALFIRDMPVTMVKGKGGGTMGSLVAFALICVAFVQKWSPWTIAWIVLGYGVLAHLCMELGEKYSLRRHFEKTGQMCIRKHNGKLVTSDFNFTCSDEFVPTLACYLLIYLMSFTLLWQIISAVLITILFRILDAKKVGLAKWADENIHTPHGVMIDDYFVGLQVTAIMSLLFACIFSMYYKVGGPDIIEPQFSIFTSFLAYSVSWACIELACSYQK